MSFKACDIQTPSLNAYMSGVRSFRNVRITNFPTIFFEPSTLLSTRMKKSSLHISHGFRRIFAKASADAIQAARWSQSSQNFSALTDSKLENGNTIRSIQASPQLSNHSNKVVWLWTRNHDVMSAAVEAGWSTFMFSAEDRDLAISWASMAVLEPMFVEGSFVYDMDGNLVAYLERVSSGSDIQELSQMAGQAHTVIMEATNWQAIPAENVVATFQHTSTPILGMVSTATEARLMFEALEKGTDGVVLRTDDPSEVLSLKNYLSLKIPQDGVALSSAKVVRIEPVGVGERVCVDMCRLLRPGEGLLVGSFARTLFLVHSECLESDYLTSRPFRVNAGPVHAYVALSGGRTAYLSEILSGSEVLVVDPHGNSRSIVVGRVKIELRPLILIEAEIESHGEFRHSLLLQNAETVRLVVPDDGPAGGRAVSVADLKLGDRVLVSVQEYAARHAGGEISEFILER